MCLEYLFYAWICALLAEKYIRLSLEWNKRAALFFLADVSQMQKDSIKRTKKKIAKQNQRRITAKIKTCNAKTKMKFNTKKNSNALLQIIDR